jgi:N-acetylglucosaminyldiphosphoundecaprenol N-acetyl-beta-D-mannosaminyltransferase
LTTAFDNAGQNGLESGVEKTTLTPAADCRATTTTRNLVLASGATPERRFESVRILGCAVSRVTVEEALDTVEEWIANPAERGRFVAATGFHGIWEAHKDPRLREVLNSVDLFCPDGIAPIWISRVRGESLPERVPGPDLLAGFLGRANSQKYRSFFLGDTEETLAVLRSRLTRMYPGHQVAGTISPPFRDLNQDEELAMVDKVNRSRPDVLWVGLGLPKQEWWIHRNLSHLRVPVVIGVGAAFRIVSGTVKRAPRWMGRTGFEWAWRLAMEPSKLWRRDFIDGPRFIYHALAETVALRFHARNKTGGSVRS